MLVDQLRELLKSVHPDMALLDIYWKQHGIDQEIQKLETQVSGVDFWKDKEQTEIVKEIQRLKATKEQYEQLKEQEVQLPELVDLFETDGAELVKLHTEILAYVRAIARFKISLLLSDPLDRSNCFLTVNSGAGGTESQDWAEMLLRMYMRFAEREGFAVSLLDYLAGEGAGIKSATLMIKGKYAYGLLKNEQGIHRLVRVSPYDANKRRHTSFAGVTVIPEYQEVTVSIDPKDLRIDTYRAGGAGGQHVNKTDSAVRITHLPTNFVVQCQNERSQTQNKETAMKMLYAKLMEKERREQKEKVAALSDKKSIEWGSQIRSYVLHPYKMVKDHRTDLESPVPDQVLDGDIMKFIETYLVISQQ